ncbi:MAG: MsnO8 family LLM class oxidoreductase [Brooklawnia sp.]|jgi:luciferase family oxidoreductase group 1
MVELSVLDIVPVRRGQTTRQAITASAGLARVADRVGCTRFWVTEHHNMPAVAATSPPVLIAMLAAQTQQLTIGSGGVMLPNHTALAVAEQFALLEAAHPGRIDLGIGRAPGTDPVTSWALRAGRADQTLSEYPTWVQQVQAMLGNSDALIGPNGTPLRLHASPRPTSVPPIWLLGSSGFSASLAAELGMPFVFAHHFSGQGTKEALDLYRANYAGPGRPRTFITVNVSVADNAEQAARMALPYHHMQAGMHAGVVLDRPLMSVDEAESAIRPLGDAAWQRLAQPWLIGEPHTVAERIFELTDRFDVDEVMIQPIASAFDADPLDSYPAREYAVRELATRLVEQV